MGNSTKRRGRAVVSAGRCFLLAALMVAASTLSGQLTVSTIRGSVTDPSGAAVVGAEIKAVNVETNIERSVKSNANGEYEVADLQRGTYRLTATFAGFKTFVVENIILEASQIRRVNVIFELGTVGTEVTVSAGAAVIATDTSKLQGSLSSRRIEDIPIVGDARNPQMLITTMPLVQSTGGVYGVQVAGQPAAQVQTGLDGFASDGTSTQMSNIHVLDELVVVQGNNSAEYARVGYYNLTSKSGTNDFHGRVAYWHQNRALNARSFFDIEKPNTTFHTYVFEASGPIKKNKTFFYASWNGQRFPQSTYFLRDVPTEQMRQGDFSQLLNLSKPVAIVDPLNSQPFGGNVMPPSRLNGTSLLAQQNYLPAPNLGGPDQLVKNYGYLHPYPSDSWKYEYYSMRIDHKISENNTLFGRWSYSPNTYVLAGNYPTQFWTRKRDKHIVVIEDTHVFSPSVVNTFRFAFYPSKVNDGGDIGGNVPLKGDEVVKELGIEGVNPQGLSAMGFPRMNITGYPSLFVRPGGIVGNEKYWGYTDSLTWAFGRHVLKIGGEYRPITNFVGSVPEGTYGVFNFNGSLTKYGHSDFLLGLPYSSQRLDPLTDRTQTSNEFGMYVQDTFKVNSRLNLDLGLRWERFGAATYKDGLIFNWEPDTGNVVVPPDAMGSISPLYPTDRITVVAGEAKQRPSLRNFAPRFGVAYRPFGETFVIRGGYGLYTETIGRFARAQGVGPFQLSETFFNSIKNGQPAFAFPNPFPVGAGNIPSQSISGYPLDTENGQIHQFNLTIEKQVSDVGFRLSYLGSRSRNLNYNIQINKPEPSLTPFAQSRRPWPQFVGASYAQNDGAANFNALTFQVQRKVGQLTFDAHWTWASNYNNMQNLENPYAPLFWGRDPYTSRHRVVLNAIWQIPVGRGMRFIPNAHPVVDHILGGWRLYWVAYMETGQYFSPSFSGSDPSNTNTSGGLPDRIADGNFPTGERSIDHWFDGSAFTVPPKGRFGNSGTNVLEGPGLHEHNLTIAKGFQIMERLRFTFMAAMQNALNHPHFSTPSANISAPASLGVIGQTDLFAPGRQIMLRGQLDF